jgi:hypothetical protein
MKKHVGNPNAWWVRIIRASPSRLLALAIWLRGWERTWKISFTSSELWLRGWERTWKNSVTSSELVAQLAQSISNCSPLAYVGMKKVRIFSDRIWDRIRLEGFRSVRIRVWIFNIRYRTRIRILKSYIYNVDIQSYLIRHDWDYPYSNLTKNMKINTISMIFVCIWSVFIPAYMCCLLGLFFICLFSHSRLR